MPREGAKAIEVRPISSKDANAVMRRLHYSGKVVSNSQLHLGVLLRGKLEGAMQFGPSLDKRKMLGLVEGTRWDGFLELNRMAFSERLPRNSESRAIGVAMRLIRKHYPQVEWVISFADGTQCGDGTIYRASGFLLTGIKVSRDLARLPSGEVVHSMTLKSSPLQPRAELGGRSFADVSKGGASWSAYLKAAKAEVVPGFQLRYVYPLKPGVRERLTVPILPFSEIEKAGARMYRGQRPEESCAESIAADAPRDQQGEGGSTPTSALHPSAAAAATQ